MSTSVDTIRGCLGDTIWFEASGTTSYDWTGNGLSCTSCDSLYVVLSGDDVLVVEGTSQSSVMAVNGNFSAGNTGFTTSYTNNQSSIWNEGTYAVGTNPNAVHPNFGSWGDHTTGSGNYMMVNGATSGTRNLWTQSVAFPPGIQVTIDFWMLTMATPPGSLRLQVNGAVVGPIFTTPNSVGTWQNYSATFTSSTTGNTQVRLLTLSNASSGNDFGLDDIRYTYACSSFDSIYVEVEQPPILSATAQGTSVACDQLCVHWTNTSDLDSTEATYWWDFGDGSPREQAYETNHCYSVPGTYYVQLFGQSNLGCPDSAFVDTVTIEKTILFQDYSITSNEGYWSGSTYVLPSTDPSIDIQFNFQSNGTIQQIFVDWGDQTNDTYGPFTNNNSFSTSHTFVTFDPLTVCAWVETPLGCTDSICFPVSFTPWIESPDIFSPNGDGYNDYYSPRFYAADRIKWKVFNRWGREVYSAETTTDVWDGTYNGRDMPDGVYFVIAEAYGADADTPYELQTTITIVREVK